jgi:hypothetical protein
MRRLAALVAAFTASLSAVEANACRIPVPSEMFDIGDVVVTGEARCLEVKGKCQLMAHSVLKGRELLAETEIEVSVYVPPEPLVVNGVRAAPNCIPYFVPRHERAAGRFFLKVREDGSLFVMYRIDQIDEAAT